VEPWFSYTVEKAGLHLLDVSAAQEGQYLLGSYICTVYVQMFLVSLGWIPWAGWAGWQIVFAA
jgi:hypothetical protein